jgi:hypothetical protein
VVLTADPRPFPALGGEHVGVAGVDVAPAQVRLQCPGGRHVVGMVGAGEDEEALRSGPIGSAPEA